MAIDPIRFVVVALALWRVAHMLTLEKGPFNWFFRLRTWTFNRWPSKHGQESWQFAGITCILCVSWWLAFPSALLLYPPSVGDWLMWSLALAGAVLFLNTLGK